MTSSLAEERIGGARMAEPGTGVEPVARPRTVAEKIEWLITYKWPPGLPEPTSNEDIAQAISASTGEELSRSSIWKLRTGNITSPRLATLKMLRQFFRLPSIGFFDESEETEQIRDVTTLMTLLNEKGIDRKTLESFAELQPDDCQMVTDMILSFARRRR